MAEINHLKICIIGDLRVECRVRLADRVFASLRRDAFVEAPVTVTVAGTAFNLAQAASGKFGQTRVIARVARDAFYPALVRATAEVTARWSLIIDGAGTNQPVIIVRDGNLDQPGGVRLLLAGTPAPYHRLTASDIDMHCEAVAQSDVLSIDGYAALSDGSRDAIRHAAHIASANGSVVCLDLVPHDLDRRIPAEAIRSLIAVADIVISEVRTLYRLTGLGDPEMATKKHLPALSRMLGRLDGRTRYWILRFGMSDIAWSAIYRGRDLLKLYETGYATSPEKAGFGDRLSVGDLAFCLREMNGLVR